MAFTLPLVALSSRAQRYLATLPRERPVPTDAVRRLIEAEGISPVPPAWLAFHDAYAGYVEDYGLDKAHLGLVHEQAAWFEPMTPCILDAEPGALRSLLCADIHPSYGFILNEHGELEGGDAGPCASFDVKIEQSALCTLSTEAGDGWLYVDAWSALPPEEQERALAQAHKAPVPEATDGYHRSYFDGEVLLFESVKNDRVGMAWVRGAMLDRLKPSLDAIAKRNAYRPPTPRKEAPRTEKKWWSLW